MIKPTIGRVVWFTPPDGEQHRWDKSQPLAALVTYVWNERMVNLSAFAPDGTQFGATSVMLVQDGDPTPPNGYYCEWMPYQKEQAAKAA